MMENKLKSILTFIHEAEGLKKVLRHSYISDGRREDVAQHSWRMALMVIALHGEMEEQLNLERVLKMAIIHDLPEIYVGDYPITKARPDNKHELEKVALEKLVKNLDAATAKEIMEVWLEYEAKQTTEAKFVSALDKLESQIQHNEADLKTWEPDEYPFSLTYGDDKVAYSETLKVLRKLVREESEQKMNLVPKPLLHFKNGKLT